MTRIMIDAKFFPHIIDEIFWHASASTLLALRVNREWRERAERKVAYHVCVAQTVAETESLPRATPVLQAPEQDFLGILKPGFPESTAPTFLSSAVVVDFHVPKFDRKIAPLLAHCSPDAVFRCHSFCHFATPATVTPKARRVVLFCIDAAARPFAWRNPLTRYRLDHIPGPKHVVIHLRTGEGGGPGSLAEICKTAGKLSGMTLIIHPWQLRHRFQPYTLDDLFLFDLGCLADLVVLAYVRDIPVTVVNLDFKGFDTAGRSDTVQNGLRQYIEDVKERCTANPSALVYSPVRFLTVKEYRAEVGEELFQIDTNEGRLCPPRRSSP